MSCAALLVLLRARTDALLYGAREAVVRGLGADGAVCRWCRKAQETLGHLMVECEMWADERAEWVDGLIAAARVELLEAQADTSVSAVTWMLLGGAVDGVRLQGWTGEVDGGGSEDASSGTSRASVDTVSDSAADLPERTHELGAPGYLAVARFLRSVTVRRFRLDAGAGMPSHLFFDED